MKIKKLLFLLIVGGIFLISCGDTASENPQSSTAAEAAENIPEATAEIPELKPDLPENVDMGGKEITIGLSNWHNYFPLSIQDVNVEELTGESINDAAYNRNIYMEQTYNCVINAVPINGPGGDVMTRLRNQVRSGDNTYDLFLFRAIDMMSPLTDGMLHDLTELPNVNRANPWWDKGSIDAMSFGGKVYSLVGDYTMTVLSCVWLTYFNKQLVADHALDDPYELVRNGNWTLQKMYEMGKDVAADLNGDGIRDVNDRFGFIHINNTATALLNGFGEKLIDIGDDGMPYISLEKESAIEKFMHIAEILNDHEVFLNAHMRTDNANIYEAGMFVWGQSLFSLGGVYYAPEMREMEQDFGLLPYPKYDATQELFNPIHAAAIPVIIVPITNSDIDNTGLFIEAFTYQGYKNIRPQFYDVMLQRKVARDNESEEMLNFIFNNISFDIGEAYNFGGIYDDFNNLTVGRNRDFVSWIERRGDRINAAIDKFIDAMDR